MTAFVLHLRDQKFSIKSDIWALMVVFIEILQYGARPYEKCENATVMWLLQNEEYDAIQQILLEGKNYLSAEMLEIFRQCLCPSESRLKTEEVTSRLNKEKFRVYRKGVEYLPIKF